MALGSGAVTPMQMAAGYAIFANGGYQISPYFITRIEDDKGNILDQIQPTIAGKNAKQVIDPRNAFLMTSMMQGVIQQGTAVRARQLGRSDIAGKTGTTSNFIDAWFCGYQENLVTIAWTGFSNPKSLGKKQTGGRVALPMWINYMDKALADIMPETDMTPPQGIIATKINPETGLRDAEGTLTEYFYQEQLPPQANAHQNDAPDIDKGFEDQLF